MSNERVSQLQEIFASDLQANDLFLVTDMSQRESKCLELGNLLLFIEGSGSFNANHSTTADTASYVQSSNIRGIIPQSSLSTQSLSASMSTNAITSSYAVNAATSSYSTFCSISETNAQTSSYLEYSGFPNGTASYSLNSNLSNVSTTAANLFYNGTPNGTASFALTSSISISSLNAISSSYTSGATITSSYSVTSSYSGNSTSSSYSQTGTQADTASYISNTFYGPKFITPIVVATSSLKVDWTRFMCPVQYIPIGTNTVLLDAYSINDNTSTAGFVQIAQQSTLTSSNAYILISYKSGGGGDACSYGAQGAFPVLSFPFNSSSFYYTFTQPADGGTVLRLIGYY